MELDLSKPELELLKQAGVSGGIRKRKRGGMDADEDDAPAPSSAVRSLVDAGAAGALTDPEAKGPATAALVAVESGGVTNTSDEEVKQGTKAAVVRVLKYAYDKGEKGLEVAKEAAKNAGQAGLYGGVAGTALLVVDSALRPGICDPLANVMLKSVSLIPAAAAYTAQCDASLAAYNTAITATLFLVAPLILQALKKTAMIAIPEATIDAIVDRVIKLTTPGGAERIIKEAIEEREKAKTSAVGDKRKVSEESSASFSWAPAPPQKRRGGKKTKKRVHKRRATRRQKILSTPVFVY